MGRVRPRRWYPTSIIRSPPVIEHDLQLGDGRTLHAYDTGEGIDGDTERLVVVWHHGTPNIGTPPEPLLPTSDRLGIRWVSYDRPGYGGSTRHLGRDVASAAAETSAVVDALGIDRFGVMGHSGGGPHALACAALLPERVLAAVVMSGLAPYGAGDLDWFAGMSPGGVASLRAALEGPEAKERYELSAPEDESAFIAVDRAALAGTWSWFGPVVNAGLAGGVGGLVDDDIAYVSPWGFEPERVLAPSLFVHGRLDRMVPSSHGEWLASRIASGELWLSPDDGHISALAAAPAALEWLRSQAST
jgi:pimeloyl-ACP methyl ester carboxylesterase